MRSPEYRRKWQFGWRRHSGVRRRHGSGCRPRMTLPQQWNMKERFGSRVMGREKPREDRLLQAAEYIPFSEFYLQPQLNLSAGGTGGAHLAEIRGVDAARRQTEARHI